MLTMQFKFIAIILTLVVPILGKYARELTNSNFKNVVSKEKMVLVNFYAHWCPHCQRLKPTYEKAAKTLHALYPSIPIAQIDCAGAGKETCWQYPIRGYPTVRLFRDGRGAEYYRGRRTEASIVQFIKERAPSVISTRKDIVPASWNGWSSWSGCSVTCGVGKRNRNRVCSGSNSPNNKGCSGEDVETESCNLKPCAEWSGWGAWSGCSVSCGMGTRYRKRVCHGADAPDNKSCVGDDAETESCNLNPCPDACKICRCRYNKMDCRRVSLTSVPQDIPSNIKMLDLSSNQIDNLPEDVFIRNTQITTLNLGKNRISQLSKGVFKPLTNLKRLYLYNNQITTILSGIFDGLSYLESLQLWNNKLKTLPPKVFDQLQSLKYLSLQGNAITSLPKQVFDRLNLLKRLQLSNNELVDLQSGTFAGLKSLQYLTLNHNKLSQLQNGLFNGLSQLGRLVLHNNNIAAVEDTVLNDLTALTMLDMRYNSITSLPRGLLSPLRVEKIRRVKLSNNPLICSCQLYREIERLKNSIWGTCDSNFRISSMTAQQYCGSLLVPKSI